jgi:hypothetical protein
MAKRKKRRKADRTGSRSAAVAASTIFMGLSEKQISSLRGAKEAASARFLKPSRVPPFPPFAAQACVPSPKPAANLVGVGIGEQISNGKHTGIMAVKFLVRIKYPDNQISPGERLPTKVDGQPVDVEQVGTFRRFAPPMPNPRTRIRPAQPGCSVGFQDPAGQFIMAGTFGALVKKGQQRFILSNNHVLADESKLPLGSPIFQPGFLDAGSPPVTDAIASLTKFGPLLTGVSNTVDCAIAKLKANGLASNAVLFIGPPTGKTTAQIDMTVHKFGRTTGFTVGRVTSVETDVSVQYEAGPMTFADQIIIVGLAAQPFSAAGDSGSLILERSTNKAVGLLFAGSTSHTIANHIGDVLNAMGVSLVV